MLGGWDDDDNWDPTLKVRVCSEAMVRSELWSKVIKQALLDDLCAMKFVSIFNDTATATFIPTVSVPVAVAMGAAAVIIKNPVVSRRFWRR